MVESAAASHLLYSVTQLHALASLFSSFFASTEGRLSHLGQSQGQRESRPPPRLIWSQSPTVVVFDASRAPTTTTDASTRRAPSKQDDVPQPREPIVWRCLVLFGGNAHTFPSGLPSPWTVDHV